MSLEFVINGEASVGAWEKPGSLQLHAPNGGNLTVDGPLGGAFLIPRPLAVVDYWRQHARPDRIFALGFTIEVTPRTITEIRLSRERVRTEESRGRIERFRRRKP